MGMISKLRSPIEGEPKLWSYRCNICNSEFHSEETQIKDVICPDCGSEHIRDQNI